MATEEPLLYRVTEAAELMGLDRSQVYILCGNGQLEWVNASTTGRRPRIRISRAAIERFIKRRTIGGTKSA